MNLHKAIIDKGQLQIPLLQWVQVNDSSFLVHKGFALSSASFDLDKTHFHPRKQESITLIDLSMLNRPCDPEMNTI